MKVGRVDLRTFGPEIVSVWTEVLNLVLFKWSLKIQSKWYLFNFQLSCISIEIKNVSVQHWTTTSSDILISRLMDWGRIFLSAEKGTSFLATDYGCKGKINQRKSYCLCDCKTLYATANWTVYLLWTYTLMSFWSQHTSSNETVRRKRMGIF